MTDQVATEVFEPTSGGMGEILHEAARAIANARSPIGFVSGGLVISRAALAPILDDPFVGTSLLVSPASTGGNTRVRHHIVNSVGSAFHEVTAPDHLFNGALVISPVDAGQVAAAVEGMALAVDGAQVSSETDPVQLIAVAIVRAGVSSRAVPVVDVPWFRDPQDRDRAVADAAKVSDSRIAQLQANRLDDGFYSTFVVRRISKPLTRGAVRLGLSPNLITVVSLVVGIGAAGFFAAGYPVPVIIGAVLLQLSLVIDCVDGEVARATRKFSALGAWLDASTDRVKEYLAYAGLAAGAMVLGRDVWAVALILVVLQTTRHMTDYDFSRVQRMREARVLPRDVANPSDGAAGAAGGWSASGMSVSGAMEMSTRMNARSAIRWAKKAIHLPIGERWLIISLVAAVLGPVWALDVLLVCGLLAFAYVFTGRILRTTTWRGSGPADASLLLSRQFDAGPLLGLLIGLRPRHWFGGVWSSSVAWAIPAALRLMELGLVAMLAIVWAPAAVVVAFWWVSVVAFHHYDVLYRAIGGFGTPRWLIWVGLGWDGRTLVVLVAFSLGIGVGVGVLGIGAVVLALLFIAVGSAQWLLAQHRLTSTHSPGQGKGQ